MVHRSMRALIAGSTLLLLAGLSPVSVIADDASAFAPSTVADLIVHGTETEQCWGRHVLARLSENERALAQACIASLEKQAEAGDGRWQPPRVPPLTVSLRLRYYLAPRALLRDLGVDLRELLRDSPPYPSEAERRAGSPMLEARPDVDVLARLHEAIEDGRIRVLGNAESEDDVGALRTLSVLIPAATRAGWEALPTGASIHVQPYFTGPPRLGSLSIRRIVATRRSQGDEPQLQLVGSHHLLDPSWGLHLAVRAGEVLLLSPRWAVGAAWTGDALPVLELTCRVQPQPAPCVLNVTLGEAGRKAPMRRHVAALTEVRDGGARVVFDIPETDRVFFGERLTVTRGEEQKQYVSVVEVVGIRGTRIEARSVPMLQKHEIEATDHVVWFSNPKR